MNDDFPRIFRARQRFEAPLCEDVPGEVKSQLEALNLPSRVSAGQSIAITAGSRGITNIAVILRSAVEYFLSLGANPFIVPAMGSHGGGTAEGQRQVIESYGITEEFCSCPIRASMETVVIGNAKEGFPVYFDKHAFDADHVVVVGRIKPHTNFTGDIQSGLMKMMMIGLGKKDGAALYHRVIKEHGFPQIIRSVAPKVIEKANILAGIAIVENSDDDTARIEALLPEDFQDREKELLQMAKQWMPRLPFQEIDILLVDQIGKNISGTGMDTNVIGRKKSETSPDQPNIKHIIVRGLTPETHGNACGIGMAELCLSRVVEQMNREVTVLNCLTACDVTGAKVPIHFPTDRENIATAMRIQGTGRPGDSRLLWIRNSGHLAEFVCSEAFLDDVTSDPAIELISQEPQPLPLDNRGMLPDDFVH